MGVLEEETGSHGDLWEWMVREWMAVNERKRSK
jgi:hypothetical protein